MRTENTVPMDRHALGTLNYIRASIDAAGSLIVPGMAGIVMGGIGLLAGVLASVPGLKPYWLEIWLLAAALAAVAGAVLMARQGSRGGLTLRRGPARKFLLCLCPALFAGALLTAVLWEAGTLHLIAGVWLLLYGCAVLSASAMTGQSTMTLVAAMGVCFVICGVVAFQMPPERHNFLLGFAFGIVHLIFGILIGRTDHDH